MFKFLKFFKRSKLKTGPQRLIVVYKYADAQPIKLYSDLFLSKNRKNECEDDTTRVVSRSACLMGSRFKEIIVITDYDSYSTEEFLEYVNIVKTRMYPTGFIKILIEA